MAQRSSGLLEPYRRKRDFSRTPEPDGSGTGKSSAGKFAELSFVTQKHAATRLHYDFSLELGGVLKSWALTKGPSLNPADKRLAVRTEDHPLAYGSFEGVIPDGYGAGTVMIWDPGEWIPKGDPHAGFFEKGSRKFGLKGERLTGGWALMRMKARSSRDRENWLLIKQRNDAADEANDPRATWTRRITTGQDFPGIKAAAAQGKGGMLRAAQAPVFPAFVKPQLATMRDAPPDGDDWLHEMKFDGYRIQALLSAGRVKLMTRNGKDWTGRYPEVSAALSKIAVRSAISTTNWSRWMKKDAAALPRCRPSPMTAPARISPIMRSICWRWAARACGKNL